jgi:hypothetical protein
MNYNDLEKYSTKELSEIIRADRQEDGDEPFCAGERTLGLEKNIWDSKSGTASSHKAT